MTQWTRSGANHSLSRSYGEDLQRSWAPEARMRGARGTCSGAHIRVALSSTDIGLALNPSLNPL